MEESEFKLTSQIHVQHCIMFQHSHHYTSHWHFVVFCNLNLNIYNVKVWALTLQRKNWPTLFSVWLPLILSMHKTNIQVSTCQSFAHGLRSVIPSSIKSLVFEVLKWRWKDLIWPGTSFRGMRWQSWLQYCASRKVVSSIPYGVTGIFHRYNPSGCTMALGSTQTPTEMSNRNIFLGVKAAGA